MIGLLHGTIEEKRERSLIITVNGVGYIVSVPAPLLESSIIGASITLYTHTHVREDDISLFGFTTSEELRFFKQLINLPGIGPRLATDIMALPLTAIRGAIAHRDTARLTSIPGIGKKIAERIIAEMKDKVGIEPDGNYATSETPPSHEEATEALINLGYQRKHIAQKLKALPKKVTTAEEIIRYFLQNQ